jgi:hypothetical protein
MDPESGLASEGKHAFANWCPRGWVNLQPDFFLPTLRTDIQMVDSNISRYNYVPILQLPNGPPTILRVSAGWDYMLGPSSHRLVHRQLQNLSVCWERILLYWIRIQNGLKSEDQELPFNRDLKTTMWNSWHSQTRGVLKRGNSWHVLAFHLLNGNRLISIQERDNLVNDWLINRLYS